MSGEYLWDYVALFAIAAACAVFVAKRWCGGKKAGGGCGGCSASGSCSTKGPAA